MEITSINYAFKIAKNARMEKHVTNVMSNL